MCSGKYLLPKPSTNLSFFHLSGSGSVARKTPMLFCSTLLQARKYSPLGKKPASCKGVSTEGTAKVQVNPCCLTKGKLSGEPFAVESSALTSHVSVSYTHLRAHETRHDLVCRLL